MTKEEFYNKWIEVFASDIPKKDIQKYVKSTGNYIWHIFSWELLKEDQYLIEDEAKEAYDKIDKRGKVLFGSQAFFAQEAAKLVKEAKKQVTDKRVFIPETKPEGAEEE